MRKEFTMTKERLNSLIDSCTPTPVMLVGGVNTGRTAQENANIAWAILGAEMGFDHMSVRPVPGKSMEVFTAEISH